MGPPPTSLPLLFAILQSSSRSINSISFVTSDQDDIHPRNMEALVEHASHIHHLRLNLPNHRRAPPGFLRLMSLLTNLHTLTIEDTRDDFVEEVLFALPSSLAVFSIDPTYRHRTLWPPYGDRPRFESMMMKSMDSVALSKVKRICLHLDDGQTLSMVNRARWMRRCEEQGIEVRDHRKYYTGALDFANSLARTLLLFVFLRLMLRPRGTLSSCSSSRRSDLRADVLTLLALQTTRRVK